MQNKQQENESVRNMHLFHIFCNKQRRLNCTGFMTNMLETKINILFDDFYSTLSHSASLHQSTFIFFFLHTSAPLISKLV